MRKAVVTGGTRGIGRAIADSLERAGWEVAVWSRATGVDVTDHQAVEAAARDAEPVDLLVANAGTIEAVGPPWEVDVDAWRRDLETSALGTFHCARSVMPGMIERRGGRIVTLASGVAVRPSPYQSGYAAGKAAVLSLTESLSALGAEHGVTVFAIFPGYVRTDMTREMHRAAAGQPWADKLLWGRALDPALTARLVLFLASGRGDALSGRCLHAMDDVEELTRRADEVRERDLYVPRLSRL